MLQSSLQNPQILRRVLTRLNAERAATLKPGEESRMRYVIRNPDLQRRLDIQVRGEAPKARVLLTGQIGVGKSSELVHYFESHVEASASGYFVRCDLEKEMQPHHADATALLFALVRDTWTACAWVTKDSKQRITKELVRIRDELIAGLVDMLDGERDDTKREIIFRFGGVPQVVSLAPDKVDTGLALMLGKAALHRSMSITPDTLADSALPDRLLNITNKLIEWLRHDRKQEIILTIDHADKIRDPKMARQVFEQALPMWRKLDVSIVMTVPFEVINSLDSDALVADWGRPLTVYPLRPADPDDDTSYEVYRLLLKSGDLDGLISEEALRVFAEACGGIPRMFVQMLREACLEAASRNLPHIEGATARAVVLRAEEQFRRLDDSHLQKLDEIITNQNAIGDARGLFQALALLVHKDKDGRDLYVAHPMANGELRRYRQRKSTQESQQ